MIKISKEEFYELYTNQKKTTTQIAKIINSNRESVRVFAKKNNILLRSSKEHILNLNLTNNPSKYITKETIKKRIVTMKKNRNLRMRKRQSETRKKLIKEGKVKAYGYGMPQPLKNPLLGIPNPSAKQRMLSELNPNFKGKLWKTNQHFLEQQKISRKVKPNKKEIIIINLLKENNLPYNYVGDFSHWINGKNPDFIHTTDKKIIEFFGNYWHKNTNRSDYTEEGRKAFYSKQGYSCLIIWENELKEQDKMIEKIKKFTFSNTYAYVL